MLFSKILWKNKQTTHLFKTQEKITRIRKIHKYYSGYVYNKIV